MDTLNQWQTFALASAFFAALTAVFGKIGVAQISSNLATFMRTIVIVLFLGGIVWVRGEWRMGTVDKRGLLFLFLSALATGFSWLCYYRALQLGPASRVAPVDKLSVFLAMVLAVVFLGEKLTPLAWLGGALILAGTLCVVLASP